MNALLWRVNHAYRRYGVRGFARKLLDKATSIRQRRRSSRTRQIFDKIYGVETAGIVRLGSLDIESGNRDLGVRYQPSDPKDFCSLMEQALSLLHVPGSAFVDLGSGKGRAVMLAAQWPFKRVIGVEFSKELNVIALRNLRAYKGQRRCDTIEIITIDAAEYAWPDLPTVAFLYSPFEEPVMRDVLANIDASLRSSPRPFLVVLTGSLPLGPIITEYGFVPLGETTDKRGIFGRRRPERRPQRRRRSRLP
jgi:SAM-dependent methyltransferase